MCNAHNHRWDCRCGWGGDGHLGHSSSQPWRHPVGSTTTSTSARTDRGSHATKCPVCGDPVFFVRPENGGSAWFDHLGWPWPKHPCMAVEEDDRWSAVRHFLKSEYKKPTRAPDLNYFHVHHTRFVSGCQECQAERSSRYAAPSGSVEGNRDYQPGYPAKDLPDLNRGRGSLGCPSCRGRPHARSQVLSGLLNRAVRGAYAGVRFDRVTGAPIDQFSTLGSVTITQCPECRCVWLEQVLSPGRRVDTPLKGSDIRLISEALATDAPLPHDYFWVNNAGGATSPPFP